jgi:DNA-binding beta-propeller fold protein YncE
LREPEGLWISREGEMAIADTGNHRILLWDLEGKPIRSFGSWGSSATWRNPPQFNRPGAVMIHPSGKFFVADTLNHRIVVVDGRGLVSESWGRRGSGAGEFDLPRAFALGKSGDVWVLDSGNSRIQVFSAPGAFKLAWGTFGADPGQLKYPLGFALNLIERVQLANTQNHRYEVFDADGTPVTYQGWQGDGPNQFREPAGVAVTPEGWIAVADGSGGRLLLYNHRYEYLGEWRAVDDPGWKGPPPRFRGVASDAESRLYLTDLANHRIVRIRPLQKVSVAPVRVPTQAPKQDNLYGGPGFPVR